MSFLFFFYILLFGIPAVLFLVIFFKLLFYIAAGIRLIQLGRRESSLVKLRSGRISVINASIGLLILLTMAFLLVRWILNWQF